MRLQSASLTPFAGTRKLEVDFQSGLNVVLGLNEAGKSTLINAIRTVLFTPTKYSKREFSSRLERFMPLQESDTIEVSLRYALPDGLYDLRKQWGARQESRLMSPRGAVIQDAAEVQRLVEEHVRVGEATYNTVLCANQSNLPTTFELLEQDGTPLHNLGAILRRVVFETDGISVEQLGNLIGEKYEGYYSRWDQVLKRPEQGRGLDNRWKLKVGNILESHYRLEEAKNARDVAQQFEEQFGHALKRVTELQDSVLTLEAYVATNKQTVDDLNKRITLELRLKQATQDEDVLSQINSQWPRLELEIDTLQSNLKTLQDKDGAIREELEHIAAHEAVKEKVQVLARAKEKQQELQLAEADLAGLQPVSSQEHRALQDMRSTLHDIQVRFEASKLRVDLTSVRGLDLLSTKGLSGEEKIQLEPGGSLQFTAGGQLQLKHSDWELRIKAGEEDLATAQTRYEEVQSKFDALLRKLNVNTFEDALMAYRAVSDAETKVARLREQLSEILGNQTITELEQITPPGATPRPAPIVHSEQVELAGELARLRSALQAKEAQLRVWEKNYTSYQDLARGYAKALYHVEHLEEQLQALSALPAGVTDAEAFVIAFNDAKRQLEDHQRELIKWQVDRDHLERNAPEQTREECEDAFREAARHFEQTQREAEALAEIRLSYQHIRREMDEGTFTPWVNRLAAIVAPLSGGRYGSLHGEDEKSIGMALRQDNVNVPLKLLSLGTKSGLALALRLSMAEFFLEDRDGFIVLDDPLVDMDPERQKLAAEVLNAFAAHKQVILVTCHPSHADLLGGHRIPLAASDLNVASTQSTF